MEIGEYIRKENYIYDKQILPLCQEEILGIIDGDMGILTKKINADLSNRKKHFITTNYKFNNERGIKNEYRERPFLESNVNKSDYYNRKIRIKSSIPTTTKCGFLQKEIVFKFNNKHPSTYEIYLLIVA